MKPRILVLNLNYSKLIELKKKLIENNFEVSLEKSSDCAIAKLHKKSFDLCIIDAGIDHNFNLVTLNKIKRVDPTITVYFLYHKLSKDKMIELYKAGTFDFFSKPLDLDILTIKLKNLLSKKYNFNERNNILRFGMFSLNEKYRILSFNNINYVKLTSKEFELLKLLITIDDEFVSKQIALKLIWKNEDYFAGKCMDVYIYRLRNLLSLDQNITIVNIRASGYKLIVN